jgi:hypothetical protein
MNARKGLAPAALSVAALVSASSEPAVAVTDLCVKPGESVCAPEPGTPVDQPERQVESAVDESARAAQAPPPAPPPNVGMPLGQRGPGGGPSGSPGPGGAFLSRF